MDTKDLAPLQTQISILETRAGAVTITNQTEYEDAIDLVSELKDIGSKIKNRKELITKPLNEALQSAKKLFAPLEAQFAQAELIIKNKLLIYKRKKDEEARIEEAKIAAKFQSGYFKQETAEKKIDQVERVQTTTRGSVGEVQIRRNKKIRIIDAALLPREYLIPDEVAIRRDALAGKTIPGVEVYEEESIAAKKYGR